ncbi:response regulator [Nocardioides sp.]|uniref:response regulator n=1 Tax=Nocardioides sp. TaxID=35761 RepID=UPI0035674780
MDHGRLFRDIVETSPDGIWVLDLDGRTIYANAEIARLYGVPESEVMDLTVFDTLDEEGRAQFRAHLADLRTGALNPHNVEVQFVRRDGSVRWVLVRESELRAEDGSLTGILHRLTDYTEQRQLADTVRANEQRLAEAQRIARIGSWEWQLASDEITGSAQLYELYGLSADSFPVCYEQFIQIVHPDDRPTVDDAVADALAGLDEFVFVARLKGPGDTWVWTRGRGVTVRDDAGRAVAMKGTHQDITEVKETEQTLQDYASQNAIMRAVASAANEAESLTEVLRQAESLVLLHDDWRRARAFVPARDGSGLVPLLIDPDADSGDDQPDEADADSAMELELARRAFEHQTSLWSEDRLTIAFCISYADEVCAVVTITSDPPLFRHDMIQAMVEQVAVQLGRVAERERTARELAQARDGAMEASRQKSEFLATMSHEIRTPLNGVIGLNDLLLRTNLDSNQHRLSSGVQVAGRALLSVINDILDFSKIEAGKLELERIDFEVRPVFDQVANVLSESARSKGLELMVSCHPAVPESLAGDPTRLAQVLTNLGSNAIKFTDVGEVMIRATAEPVDDRVRLMVEVVDTGVGVDELSVDDLFAPFTQADASTTRIHGGTGLGLAISRDIVEAMGGEIGLKPNPGGGSVFWFTLMLDPSVGDAPDPADAHATAHLCGRRVLIVDDNVHNRLILEEQLAWWGVRSYAASSADEALQMLDQALIDGDPFEAALLDMAMPVRDGFHLAADIRRDPAFDDLELVMLTSLSTPDPARVRRYNISECLTKPVLAGVLRSSLLEHLAGVGTRTGSGVDRASTEGPTHRILVVEDNTLNQLVAAGILESLGYEAVTASDGIEALEILESEQFDAVLMDVQMPRLDGYGATRRLRERESDGRRIPVIAMTAAAVEGERERCLAAGMDDFLTKPVDQAGVAAILREWLDDDHIWVEPDRPAAAPPAQEPPRQEPLRGLDIPRIDELRDLDPGDTSYLDRAIGNFVTRTPTTLETIRTAWRTGDSAQLKAVSHKLAGGALNLGVERAGRIAQQIETAVDQGTSELAGPLIEALDEALTEGRTALLDYQATYSDEAPAD